MPLPNNYYIENGKGRYEKTDDPFDRVLVKESETSKILGIPYVNATINKDGYIVQQFPKGVINKFHTNGEIPFSDKKTPPMRGLRITTTGREASDEIYKMIAANTVPEVGKVDYGNKSDIWMGEDKTITIEPLMERAKTNKVDALTHSHDITLPKVKRTGLYTHDFAGTACVEPSPNDMKNVTAINSHGVNNPNLKNVKHKIYHYPISPNPYEYDEYGLKPFQKLNFYNSNKLKKFYKKTVIDNYYKPNKKRKFGIYNDPISK